MLFDENKEIKKEKRKQNNRNKGKILSKIFSYIILLFSLIIIIFSTTLLIQIKILNKNYGSLFGYTVLEVKSGSMQQEIQIGDLVIVKILASLEDDGINQIKENINIDDIITFSRENHLITHRVIEKDQDSLITKGDANNTEDKPIKYEDIVGKVVKIIPNIAIWKKVFSEKSVLIPLSSGVLLLIITLMIDDNNEIEKDVNEKKKQKVQKGKRFKK